MSPLVYFLFESYDHLSDNNIDLWKYVALDKQEFPNCNISIIRCYSSVYLIQRPLGYIAEKQWRSCSKVIFSLTIPYGHNIIFADLKLSPKRVIYCSWFEVHRSSENIFFLVISMNSNKIKFKRKKIHEAELVFTEINIISYHAFKRTWHSKWNLHNLLSHTKKIQKMEHILIQAQNIGKVHLRDEWIISLLLSTKSARVVFRRKENVFTVVNVCPGFCCCCYNYLSWKCMETQLNKDDI